MTYEQDLDTWYKENYKEATDDPEQYFNHVKFNNFDIIYNDIHKSKLQKSIKDYKAINKEHFYGYGHRVKDNIQAPLTNLKVAWAKGLECTHFLEKYLAVELSAMKKRFKNKQKTNYYWLL